MNDIDELLQAGAQDWRDAQPAPPNFDAALRTAATSPTSRRIQLLDGSRVVGATGAVAAVAATVVAAVLITTQRAGHHPAAAQRPEPAPSIVVHGRSVPYAGEVPWGGAVIVRTDARTITVSADSDRMVTDKQVCGVPAERVYVHETSTSVTILVAGYETPLPATAGCPLIGHLPQARQAALRAPLGHRALLDAVGMKPHPVLDASAVPVPEVPGGFAPDPVQWDEKSGLVRRGYHTAKLAERIYLDYGTTATIPVDAGRGGSILETVQVGTATATVWCYTDIYDDLTTVVWSVGSHRLGLAVYGGPKQHLSIGAAIALARSVR